MRQSCSRSTTVVQVKETRVYYPQSLPDKPTTGIKADIEAPNRIARSSGLSERKQIQQNMATPTQENLKQKNEAYAASFDKGHLALPQAKKYLVGQSALAGSETVL